MQHKKIKFIGDAQTRIREDALRIVRYFRFLAQLNFDEIDEESLQACLKNAALIQNLSGERINAEMQKFFAAQNPSKSLELMGSEIQEYIFGKNVAAHNLDFDANWKVKFAKILDEEILEFIISRWKISNELKKYFTDILKFKNAEICQKDFKEIIRNYSKEFAGDVVQLKNLGENFEEILREFEAPDFPISGDDLKAKGFSQGIEMGEALKKLESIWVDSDYEMRQEDLLKNL